MSKMESKMGLNELTRGVGYSCILSGGSRGKRNSLPFQLLGAAYIPWLVASLL